MKKFSTTIGILFLLLLVSPKADATYLSKLYFTLFPKCIEIPMFSPSTSTATGSGGMFIVPRISDLASMSGMVLRTVEIQTFTAGTTGTLGVNIRNMTKATNLLSTVVSVDSAEKTSATAATPYVINTANDDIVGGDVLYPFVTNIHSTPANGLTVKSCFTPQ